MKERKKYRIRPTDCEASKRTSYCLGCRKKFTALSEFNRFCTKCQDDISNESPRKSEKPTNVEDYR